MASKSRTEVGDSKAAVGGSGSRVGVGTGVRQGAKVELSKFFEIVLRLSVGYITHQVNAMCL